MSERITPGDVHDLAKRFSEFEDARDFVNYVRECEKHHPDILQQTLWWSYVERETQFRIALK